MNEEPIKIQNVKDMWAPSGSIIPGTDLIPAGFICVISGCGTPPMGAYTVISHDGRGGITMLVIGLCKDHLAVKFILSRRAIAGFTYEVYGTE